MNKEALQDQQEVTETQSHPDAAPGDSSNDRPPAADNTDTLQSTGQGSDHTDSRPTEIGGRKGLEPTRYGDWEKNGRCIDF